jgi:release factor glutamine methyltransferase
MATEVRELLREGVQRLARVTPVPQLESELLLARALGWPRSALYARGEEPILDCDATDRYESLLTRRLVGEPIAYLLGEKEFWSLRFAVTPDVLIPRPETELVVERALAHLPADVAANVLDLGTGSGAIAIAIARERPLSRVVGVDRSAAACAIALRNAADLGAGNLEIRHGDWYAPVLGRQFAVIASNPPYVARDDPRLEHDVRHHEPHAALFAGDDGLEALRAVVAGAAGQLTAGGWLIVEHGDRQGSAVRDLMVAAGLEAAATFKDLSGADRCTEACRAGGA